jgi:SAM-dependent methyltransferase
MPLPPPYSPEPTRRFSDRVDDYVRYRPTYPDGVIGTLRANAGLGADTLVADIGSGTGIFAQLLLPHCKRVHGIEPNEAMRAAGERLLAGAANFSSSAGTAEATNLPDASINLVTAAQSFHWFDGTKCRREFRRILRPGGFAAIIWNERLTAASSFLMEYEALLRHHAPDYPQVNHLNIDAAKLASFFGPAGYHTAEFPNEQRFDFAGLQGRLLSSSYAPNAGHPGHPAMLAELAKLFARHEQSGLLSFLYTTRLYYGRLA